MKRKRGGKIMNEYLKMIEKYDREKASHNFFKQRSSRKVKNSNKRKKKK